MTAMRPMLPAAALLVAAALAACSKGAPASDAVV